MLPHLLKHCFTSLYETSLMWQGLGRGTLAQIELELAQFVSGRCDPAQSLLVNMRVHLHAVGHVLLCLWCGSADILGVTHWSSISATRHVFIVPHPLPHPQIHGTGLAGTCDFSVSPA